MDENDEMVKKLTEANTKLEEDSKALEKIKNELEEGKKCIEEINERTQVSIFLGDLFLIIFQQCTFRHVLSEREILWN